MVGNNESEKLFHNLWEMLKNQKIDRKEFLMQALGAGLSLASIGAFLAKVQPPAKDGNDPLAGILADLPGGADATISLDENSGSTVAQSSWSNNGWTRSPPIWGNSDRRIKRDIELIDRLDNGLNLYRFRYLGDDEAYVGVIAQEVQEVAPSAVTHAMDGYLHVYYDQLGLELQTNAQWLASKIASNNRQAL
jgi:hypothetical protein